MYVGKMFYIDDVVCKCAISLDNTRKTWTISAWYTTEDYKHQGYGKKLMKAVLDKIKLDNGIPDNVQYIWNGENSYVFDWLNDNFNPVCKCPLAVRKYASDDDWDSHIYILNREKFLNHFELN
jgi:predicted GNAT family acetyltransferase